MRRSKLCYINMGMDILCALICALSHSLLFLAFVGAAFLMGWLGDKAHELETKGEI